MSSLDFYQLEDISLWAGWWDEPEEGVYTDINTGQVLTEGAYQPWFPGEPNGRTVENCAIIWFNRDAWNDQVCDIHLCGYCELEEAPILNIRGRQHVPKNCSINIQHLSAFYNGV